ncbi:MAG: hypothetical protein IKJ74_02000 [Clostridia bacterium]|nr:hypothetical protein [Clostridia bacterium]
MTKRNGKEKQSLTFSYLDVFFILLAGCIISFGIYLFTEDTAAAPAKEYCVEAKAFYREALIDTLPREGEALYDGAGNQIGEILSAEVLFPGARSEAYLTFTLRGDPPAVGESFAVETATALAEAEILNVTESERSEAL